MCHQLTYNTPLYSPASSLLLRYIVRKIAGSWLVCCPALSGDSRSRNIFYLHVALSNVGSLPSPKAKV